MVMDPRFTKGGRGMGPRGPVTPSAPATPAAPQVGPGSPPVEYINQLEPFVSPQFIPPSPGNLPPPRSLLPFRTFESGATSIDNSAIDNNGPGPIGLPPTGNTSQGAQIVLDPHHYATLITFPNFPAPQTQDNTQLFLNAPQSRRNLLMFRNNSATANLYIEFGHLASANSTLRLTPNQIVLFDVVVPQDDLYVFADAANGLLSFAYSTIAYS